MLLITWQKWQFFSIMNRLQIFHYQIFQIFSTDISGILGGMI